MRLNKALYGLRCSGRDWNEHLNSVLIAVGLTRSSYDPCIYFSRTDTCFFALGIFVDDKVIAYDDYLYAKTFIEAIAARINILPVQGQYYLSLEISRPSTNEVVLSQYHYINKIVEKYGQTNAHPLRLPCVLSQKIDDCIDSPPTPLKPYQEMLGSLMYLALSGRPDIAFTVTNLARFNHSPTVMHLEALKRVIRYLKGTSTHALHAKGQKDDTLNASVDASWDSGCDSKAVTGYVIRVGVFPIAWRVKRQPLIALSSCEAEISALCDLATDLIPIQGLMSEIAPQHLKLPIEVKTDSKSAMDLVAGGGNARSRHFLRRINFVKQEVQAGNIKLIFVPSDQMIAYVMTK